MPVTFHGFSIRDYTSIMRSLDVFKCWPFPAAGVSREQAESCLPPIIVPKSRRCSDDLAATGEDKQTENQPNEVVSDESESVKMDKLVRCSVCRDFNAATVTAVDAHVDGCFREERRRMRRSKLKTPKKRSIAEIFELKQDVEEEKPPPPPPPPLPLPPPPEIETVLNFSPFDAGKVSVTFAKLRWLSKRLKVLRSNRISFESRKSGEGDSDFAEEDEKSEILRPVCRVFNATTVTAANAHIDGCLAAVMKDERCRKVSLNNPKPKLKPQKKRSLADILTVAPQIDVASNGKLAVVAEKDEEGEENIEEFEKKVIRRKKSRKNNVTKKRMLKKKNKFEKRDVSSLNDESKNMNKRSWKKKRKLKNEFTTEKEDAYKRKMQNPVSSFKKLGTVGNKKVKLDDIDASSAPEKKLGLKILSEEKKEMVKNWDSVGKKQKTVSPVRGILKSHRHVSGSTSSGSNIRDDTEESQCDVHVLSSDKHVRFSAEDYLLASKKRNSFDETVFNLSSYSPASSSGNVEGTVNSEKNRNDNMAISTDKRKEVFPVVESKQFSDTLGQVAENFLMPCTNQEKSKHSVEKSESETLSNVTTCDNNLHGFDRGNTATMLFASHANAFRSLSPFQRGQTSGITTQVCESEAFSCTGKFIDHLGEPTFQSRAVHSNANTRTFLEPSPSYSVASCNEVNERPEFPLHTYGNNVNKGQALGGRSLSCAFSADMIDNSFLMPGWGKGSVKSNCMEQNFYGLPLNSHGELINFGTCGKVGMNQPETSCTLRVSLSGLAVNNVLHQNSQECLNIGKKHVFQKTPQVRVNHPFPRYPGRFGVREFDGREREDIYKHNSDWCSNHYVQPLDAELNLMRNPFIEQDQLDQAPHYKEYGMISPRGSSGLVSPSSSQPTVRLMGKDVPIGRSSKEKQQFVEVLWAEEESRRRHYSVDAAKDSSLLGRCSMPDWPPGSQLQIQTENVLQSVKIQSNQASQSTLLMKGPNSEFLNVQSNHISQNGSIGTSRNISTNFHLISKEPTSYAIYNRAHENLPEQFISGAKPQGHCFPSQVPSSPCNFNQSTSSNGELNDWKKHQHVTNSAFEFPFLHPIVEEQAESSWFNRSYRSFPSWSLGTSHEKLTGNTSSTSFHQNSWRNNVTIPSVNHSADGFYPPIPVNSLFPRKALLCPTPIAHPYSPHASVSTVIKPDSSVDGCRNIFKVTDRVKLDDMIIVRDHHPRTNSRKRPSASLMDPLNSNKLPNIEMQKNYSGVTRLAQETSSTNLQQNTREVELDLQVGARSKCYQNEAQNLNPSCLGFGCSNLDGVVISGPVKLSHGANHVLKPSQNQDNLTPIHSAIPIAATTDLGRDLQVQGKMTKMYIF